jgi:RNA polymerase sigma-B factor
MSNPLKDLPLDELLQRLTDERDDLEMVREEILQRGTSIIQDIIKTDFAASGFENEELFRPGYLGLMNAVYNFDLSHGKEFREYAENLIKGEIRHHIRDTVRHVPIPRWMKDLNRQIEIAEARLLREKGNLPSLSELAEAVNITEEGLAEVFKARETMSYVSLNAEQRANDPVFEIDISKIRSKQSVAFPVEYRIRLASALEKLADLQQYLLHNLFRPSE